MKKIIAGQEERLNWPRWVEVFTASLPRPGDNGNLTETSFRFNSTVPAPDQPAFNQVQLWRGEGRAGLDALEWFNRRMQKGVPIEEAVADELSAHPKSLAMVNVETVHTRYVTDINAFLQATDKVVLDKFTDSIAEWMKDDERELDTSVPDKPRQKPKAPAEAGWVVEIRGYTDHDKGGTFVRQALLRNLQRIDTFAKDEGKVGRFINAGVKDPVGKDDSGKSRISHAFVYRVFAPIPDPQPGVLPNITRGSFLDTIVDGSGGSGQARLADGRPRRDAARPMPGAGRRGQGAAPDRADRGARRRLAPAWAGLGGCRLGGTGGRPPAGFPPPKGDSTRRRFEFVVMVVWREPTPSASGAAHAVGAPTPPPGQ